MESSAKPGPGKQPMEGSAKPLPAVSHEQAQATEDLFADLRKMLNNPEFSDVVFICQDGVPVHASRILLTARSPMLMKMLRISKEREIIPLPYTSCDPILAIFEFLYTGTIIKYVPRNSSNADELIRVAKDFQLREEFVNELLVNNQADGAEEPVHEFSVNNTADGVDDRTKEFVDVEFGTLSGTMRGNPVSLVRILNSKQLEPLHFRGLSEKALRYFLQRSQSTADPEMVSLEEYFRFRHVILWWVTRIFPESHVALLSLLPDEKSAENILREAPKVPPTEGESYLNYLLARRRESAALLSSLLAMVNFRRIHAKLLVAVVEPLKIVTEAQLMEAFRFQALHHKAPPRYEWEHGGSHSSGDRLQKINNELAFARFAVPLARPYGVYEWEIIVEELCDAFCEIGLHRVDGLQDGKPNFTGTLAKQPTGRALRLEYKNFTISPRGGNNAWEDFKKDFKKDSTGKNPRVRVRLDMSERSCAFSVNGDKFLPAWMNLPHGVYFPAVSLGREPKGRVRIKLVKGFKML